MEPFLEFEKPIAMLEKKLQEMRELSSAGDVDLADEIKSLEKKVAILIDETYLKLSPWQRVQLSRHPNRPYTRDYVDVLFPDFMELQGDRTFSDDQAILGGVGTWKSKNHGDVPVLILGHQKGRTTKERMERNFGMARPEGYRKAMRLVALAERSRMPVICFIDTPGAYPGIEAEERGQSQAIAESIQSMFSLTVPTLAVVIGEGGSGGALAIGVCNKVLMQEHTIYSVISPESCASILWSDSSLAERAADRLKMNPPELLKMGVIDAIVPEPRGGAHRDWKSATENLRKAIVEHLEPMLSSGKPAKVAGGKGKSKTAPTAPTPQELKDSRLAKFRAMGEHALASAPESDLSQ